MMRFKRFNSICQYGRDDAEHAIFSCDRWWRPRRELVVVLNVEITLENVIGEMLLSNSRWDAIIKFISVMKKKEDDERVIQASTLLTYCGLKDNVVGIEPHIVCILKSNTVVSTITGTRKTKNSGQLIEVRGEQTVVDTVKEEASRAAGGNATVIYNNVPCWK